MIGEWTGNVILLKSGIPLQIKTASLYMIRVQMVEEESHILSLLAQQITQDKFL